MDLRSSRNIGASATSRLGCLIRSSHRGMKGSQITHHTLILVLLIGMNGLSMLAKVIETGKLLPTVAGKWSFTSMFPDMSGKVLASAKHHPTFTVAPALKGLCRSWAVPFGGRGARHI